MHIALAISLRKCVQAKIIIKIIDRFITHIHKNIDS